MNCLYRFFSFTLFVMMSYFSCIFIYGYLYYAWIPPHETIIEFSLFENKSEILLPKSALREARTYGISVDLELADSADSYEIGPISFAIELYNEDLCFSSESSSFLEYRSKLHRLMRTFMFSFPLICGFTRESQWVQVLLTNNYVADADISKAIITTSLPDNARVYKLKLKIVSKLRGILFFMYHYRFLTFFVVTFASSFILMMFLLLLTLCSRTDKNLTSVTSDNTSEDSWMSSCSQIHPNESMSMISDDQDEVIILAD